MRLYIAVFILFTSVGLNAEERVISVNAPQDKPIISNSLSEMKEFHQSIEPYIREAKKTYPDAKKKYLKGLAKRENFFLTTRLHDEAGRVAQVFILVKEILGDTVKGVIYNDIKVVSGFKYGQDYVFSEAEIIDWLISKPDGSEEGNYVGKYIDSIQ